MLPPLIVSNRQTGIDQSFGIVHFQAINARIPQATATTMQTIRAMLLKSKKPLPVPVIAQAIAKMVMRTKTILTIFKMAFFKSSHSFIKFQLIELFIILLYSAITENTRAGTSPALASSNHILNRNDKSEHTTHLEHAVRIIIVWSECNYGVSQQRKSEHPNKDTPIGVC